MTKVYVEIKEEYNAFFSQRIVKDGNPAGVEDNPRNHPSMAGSLYYKGKSVKKDQIIVSLASHPDKFFILSADEWAEMFEPY